MNDVKVPWPEATCDAEMMRLAALKQVSEPYLRAGALSALAALCCAWILFLFFQHGHAWDESEHAHAAWLVSRGERPLDDFFQHHQPLLWSMLGLYFHARPYLTERSIERSMPAEDSPRVEAIIRSDYASPQGPQLWPTYFGGLVTRTR
jgi:hypothetical protein